MTAPDPAWRRLSKNQILYRSPLTGEDRVYFSIDGFGKSADDYKVRNREHQGQVGMTITGDRPLYKMSLWSIRSVIAVEPFIDLSIEPGSNPTGIHLRLLFASACGEVTCEPGLRTVWCDPGHALFPVGIVRGVGGDMAQGFPFLLLCVLQSVLSGQQ